MAPEGGALERREREWFLAEEELVMLVTLSHWMVLSGFVLCKLTLLSFGAGLKSTYVNDVEVLSWFLKEELGKRKEREWFLVEEELVMLITLSHWMVLSGFVSCKLTLLSFGAG